MAVALNLNAWHSVEKIGKAVEPAFARLKYGLLAVIKNIY